jgi:hypothetical protein
MAKIFTLIENFLALPLENVRKWPEKVKWNQKLVPSIFFRETFLT